mgnify:CR=1 FL=1
MSENTLSALYLSPIELAEVEAAEVEVVVPPLEKEFVDAKIQTDHVVVESSAKETPVASSNPPPRPNLPALSDAPAPPLAKSRKTKSQMLVQSKSMAGIDMSNTVPVNINTISMRFRTQEEEEKAFVAEACSGNRGVHPLAPLDLETKAAVSMERDYMQSEFDSDAGNTGTDPRPQRVSTKHMKPNTEISRTALWKIHAELEQKKMARLGLGK